MMTARSGRHALGIATTAVVLLLPILRTAPAVADASLGDTYAFRQPDGERVSVRVWGDEYFQHVESLDGYTLVRDPATYEVCFARLASDGQDLVSTGIRAGDAAVARLGIAKHLWLPPAVRTARAEAARAAAPVWGSSAVADEMEALRKSLPDKGINDPQPVTSGDVKGLTILVDFFDSHATKTPDEVRAFLNQPGFNDDNCNGSARDYYLEVSGGRLDFSNVVPDYYYRAINSMDYYEDPSQSAGWRARELVLEALNYLAVRGFDFSSFDANGDGFIDAIHCIYAGTPSFGWGVGLWPQTSFLGFAADGVVGANFSISYVGPHLRLATYVHESGHLLFFWPDLYDVGFESYGAGLYCLMSASAAQGNPEWPCAPLRYKAGWTEPFILDGVHRNVKLAAGSNQVLIVPHAVIPYELYMFENREATGRDATLPSSGLAIWHVDWHGSNNEEQANVRNHYMVSLVQADGRMDLEHKNNYGDAGDLFGAPDATSFTPSTNPAAVWWRFDNAPINIENISAPGDTISFNFRDGIGVLPIDLQVLPTGLHAPWLLTGPDDYIKRGSGSRLVFVPNPIEYTITWQDIPGWTAPPPTQVLADTSPDGPAVPVSATYTLPPFTPVAADAVTQPGTCTGASVVDIDADGDEDLFLAVNDGSNRLLRNDGDWTFVDATPAALAQPGRHQAGVFADVDNDGDQDVYLANDGESDRLLIQAADGSFAEHPGLAASDTNQSWTASFTDIDNNGLLDVFVVISADRNRLLMAEADDHKQLVHLSDEYDQVLQIRRSGRCAAWCDFDGDGWRDVYMSSIWNWNRLARNRGAAGFENVTQGGLGDPHRGGSAAWGDLDGDGVFDLYVANDHAPDRLFYHYAGVYVIQGGAYLSAVGDSKGVVLADFDNDGDLDIYVARDNDSDLLLMNYGEMSFLRSELLTPGLDSAITGVAAGDFDGDGGVDLVIVRKNAPNFLLRNTMQRGHWVEFDLRGTSANADAIGARVRLVAGGKSQLREVSGGGGSRCQDMKRLAFGLGASTTVDSVIVSWPGNSRVQIVTQLPVDRLHTLVEPDRSDDEGNGGGEVPRATRLFSPYPNPFNPAATIAFDIAQPGRVIIEIYSLDGRRVTTLLDENRPIGHHTIVWRGHDQQDRRVASGTYFARMTTPDQRHFVKRMALVR